MELNDAQLQTLIADPDFEPEQLGARFWFEAYVQQRQQLAQVQAELEALKEKLHKLTQRSSENSSQPPSQDAYKKPSKGFAIKPKKKRSSKYDHRGTTCNGFEQVDIREVLPLENCPVCGSPVEAVVTAPVRRHQVAELVTQPVVVTEYERAQYRCSTCGWQGYGALPLGCREDFSYGANLSSLVGWLGYGGHLSW
ncbi:hypothetical protein GS597_11290 [Synechococcales cyanobacterium C]|uniref:DUF6444 domain-containing protein n=1 Tax=Petrachloros mirabilis ULC683 TaxID=2781853 RepID=A0A8K1ZZP9_9CYAN|nr:hypothetical protein [Petrachloros mirabilis ULC683]